MAVSKQGPAPQLVDAICTAIKVSFESAIKPALDRLTSELTAIESRRVENHKENSDKRHAANNELQKVVFQLAELKLSTDARLNGHDQQFRSILGDGMGSGGVLNEIKAGQKEQGKKLDDVVAKIDSLEARSKSKSAGQTVGMIVQILSGASILLTAIWWFFTHVH